MIKEIKGLHHITSLAEDAARNNAFFTGTLGLRRVKKTVNFDAPDVYHLYYGDETGTPGSVMTYFPFENIADGQRGTGEVGVTEFAVPRGSLAYWRRRLAERGVPDMKEEVFFGDARLSFDGPDKDSFALVESELAGRVPWTGTDIPADVGILGFKGARIRVRRADATGELLKFMGYQKTAASGAISRFQIEGGNAANTIDIEELPNAHPAGQGAGSVHHIAFAVENREAQLNVRRALQDILLCTGAPLRTRL